jgi:MFS family permease
MMLQEEGIYGDVCPNHPPCQVGALAMPAGESETARTQLTRWASQEQGVRLQMIYTVATSAFCFCVWPTGVVLDTYGPRACCMMGALFFGIGCALFAYSDATHDFFLPGFVFMAIGGLPVVLSMMHLSELMPWLAGTIMSIFNVMIDVSSLDLQLFRVAVSNGLCSRQEAFTYYMAVPVAIFVTAPLLWPNHKYERAQTGADAVEDVVLESPRSHDGACQNCLPTPLPASRPARERGRACRPPACLRCLPAG